MSARLTPPHPLRVFMTADAVGGVWQYALDLASGLAGHGVATTLAVLGPDPDDGQEADARAVPGLRLVATGLPLDWTAESPDEIERAGRAIAALAAEDRPDIVHLNSPALAAAASFDAPVVAACHSCVATWWQKVRTGPLPAEFVWRTILVDRGYRAARALAAPTAAFAQATAETYGLSEPPRAIHNGRHPLVATGELPVTEEVFAFTAGRLWDDGKNLVALDRAAARLDLPVLAAGPVRGPNGAEIALERVRPLGRLDEAALARILAARPIFVSAALYEPFGLAVLEAAQAGCALVLSDIPTFRELWDGVAVFVPPQDDGALAAAIGAIARDPDARARLGEAARERAGRYTVAAMTEGWLDLYRSLLPQAAASPREEEAA